MKGRDNQGRWVPNKVKAGAMIDMNQMFQSGGAMGPNKPAKKPAKPPGYDDIQKNRLIATENAYQQMMLEGEALLKKYPNVNFKDLDKIPGLNNTIDKYINFDFSSDKMIKDNMGQWKHPGKNTQIQGDSITMKGVKTPVLGVGSTGEQKMMLPGKEYVFPKSEFVNEFPIKRAGGTFSFGSRFSTNSPPSLYFMTRYSNGGGSGFKPFRFPGSNSALKKKDNLGDARRELLLYKMSKFEHGGKMKKQPTDLMKKGVNATMYPLPFQKGGKIKEAAKKALNSSSSTTRFKDSSKPSMLFQPMDSTSTVKKDSTVASTPRFKGNMKFAKGGQMEDKSKFNAALKKAMGGKMKNC